VTAIVITAIIAATLLINSAIIAARDVAKAKHQTRHCNGCTCTDRKEQEA
jgi:hypothetical protein